MWSPEDQYPHRAGRAFEADLNLTYLAPGAFTILPADVQERLPPNPQMTNNRHRLTPTTRKNRNAAFAIIAEPGSSNPGSRSPSPTGRVSPFRGRGFNPAGSRHASPLPSPPPTATPRRSKIPLARKESNAQSLNGNPNLSKQLSKSLNNISPRRIPAKPPTGRYSKTTAFQKLSPIVGSSPEQTPHGEGDKSSSKIPRSRSQPPSRTASRNPSRSASRNVSRESSPAKISSNKVSYKHVKSKVNSFSSKPKVPPKPTQVPSESSVDSVDNSNNKIKTEATVEPITSTNNKKRVTNRKQTPDKTKSRELIKSNSKVDESAIEEIVSVGDNSKTQSDVEDSKVTPTLIDLLTPSTTTVVSSTTTTVTQPLKIDAKLELDTKDDVYLPDARALSATSVSAAMNRMNDTVLDTKTFMKGAKLVSDVRTVSSRSVMSPSGVPQPPSDLNSTNTQDVVTLEGKERIQEVLPPVENKSSTVNNNNNSGNTISINNHNNNNSINGRIGVVTPSALPRSANERIKEARTLIAADVQPLKINVKEKPSNADVQSGNVRINMGVVNGVNEYPGLPPPQSPPEQQPTQQAPPMCCCAPFFKCCHKKSDTTLNPDTSKSNTCGWCCMKKKNNVILSKGSSDLSLIESQTDEAQKKWWKRLKCCHSKNKVGDATTGCFAKTERKNSWIPKITEDTVESEKRSAKDACKNFLRTVFCINFCTRKRRRREAEEAIKRRASVLSKKKSLTPAPPEEPKFKLEAGLVEHTSVMKGAIPVLPVPLAWMCLILNSILPGTGTIISGFLCLCIGKARFNQKDGFRQRFGAFVIDLIIGCGQAFTVLFCLVGWGWSLWWGIIMLKIARKHRKIRRAEKAMEEDEKKRSNNEHLQANDVERGTT